MELSNETLNFQQDIIATQLHETAELLMQLFDNDTESANLWLLSPNHLFFDKTPVEVIFEGNGNTVIDVLKEWSETKNA